LAGGKRARLVGSKTRLPPPRGTGVGRRAEPRAPTWIGFADTSSFTPSGIHLNWVRQRSPRFSHGSRRIGASAHRRRTRRSAPSCSCIAPYCASRSPHR